MATYAQDVLRLQQEIKQREQEAESARAARAQFYAQRAAHLRDPRHSEGTPDWWLMKKEGDLSQWGDYASEDLYQRAHFGESIANDARQKLLEQLAEAQKGQKFEGDVQSQLGKQLVQTEETGRLGLSEQLAGVKRGASQRGLLFSGLKQSADTGAYNQAAAKMAEQSAKYQQEARDKMSQYRGEQVNRGLDELQLAQQRAAADYTTALQRRKTAQQRSAASQGAYGALGGAGGGILGGALTGGVATGPV